MRATSMAFCLLTAGLLACGDDPAAGPGSGQGGTGATSNSSGPGSGQGGAGGESTSTGSGGAPSFAGETRVDREAGAAKGSAHLAIAPDGSTLYVSWVASDDVFVAASVDGGESFAPPVQVGGSAAPLVSMARLPYVVADDARVAVVFNDQAGAVHLHVSPAGPSLSFDQGSLIGTDIPTTFRDFPKPVFLPGGEIAIAWHGYPASGARVFVSREADGFASEAASGGAPGLPCECCPIDITTTGAGDLLTAFRNNVGNLREMWLASAPAAGAFSSWVAASDTEGTVPQCPMEGPKLAEAAAGDLWMVWSTRGSDDIGIVHASLSGDGGASWSGGTPIAGFQGDQPAVAIGASGRIYVAAASGSNDSALAWSDDGTRWSGPSALAVADGAIALPQAGSDGGVAALAGVSSAGTVWLLRME